MLIKEIVFIDEIRDVYNDNIDVGVKFEDGPSYTIVVRTPRDLLDQMNQEKTNFIRPGAPMIIVRKLTKPIVMEAIEDHAKDDGYWLKHHQFYNDIDISVLNKLDAEARKRWEVADLEGLDELFYPISKYIKNFPDDEVLLSRMLFFTLISFITYCLLKPGLMNFFSNIIQ